MTAHRNRYTTRLIRLPWNLASPHLALVGAGMVIAKSDFDNYHYLLLTPNPSRLVYPLNSQGFAAIETLLLTNYINRLYYSGIAWLGFRRTSSPFLAILPARRPSPSPCFSEECDSKGVTGQGPPKNIILKELSPPKRQLPRSS